MEDVAFSPDGKLLGAAGVGGARVWSTADWTLVSKIAKASEFGHQIAFTPDSEHVAVAFKNADLRLWSVAGGEPIVDVPVHQMFKNFGLSPDGQTLATYWNGPWTHVIRISDLSITRHLSTGLAGRVVYSPSGRILAATVGNEVQLWDIETGELRRKLKGYPPLIHDLAFSPDGQALATSSADDAVRVWRVQEDGEPRVLLMEDGAPCVAFSPVNRTVAVGSERGKVRLWNLA